MPGNDELFQAFSMLQNSVKGLAVQRAMQDAQTQTQNIRESEGKDFEKLQQYRGVAQNLTMKLAGLGQPASEIKVLADELVPKLPTIQNAEQGLAYGRLTGDQNMIDMFQGDVDKQYKQQMDLIRAKNTIRLENKAGEAGNKAKKEFMTRKDVQEAFKGRDTILSGNLDLQNDPSSPNYTLGVMKLKGMIKTVDPRISDADFKSAVPDQSLVRSAQAMWQKFINSDWTPTAKSDMEIIGKLMLSAQEKRIKEKTGGFANSRYKSLGYDSADTFNNELLTESGLGGNLGGAPTTNVNAAASQAAQQPAGPSSFFTKY